MDEGDFLEYKVGDKEWVNVLQRVQDNFVRVRVKLWLFFYILAV